MKFKAPKGVNSLGIQGKSYEVDADGNITIDDADTAALQELVNVHGWKTPEAAAASEAASQAAWAAPIAAAVQNAGPVPTY